MKKLTMALCSIVLLTFTGNMAIASPLTQVNVDGNLLTDLKSPIVKNSTTFVPIRVLEHLGMKVKWNNKTKIVNISDRSNNLQLSVGSKTALKDKQKISLSTPPFINGGTTYVPLRFIGENFGSTVEWDSKNNGIVIISLDVVAEAKELIKSGDLAKARLGVISLPRVQFHESTDRPEGESFSFIFPENDYSKMYFVWSDSIYYYELKNGYVSLLWEGKIDVSKQNDTSNPLSKLLGGGLKSVWGEQPSVTKRLAYFNDSSGSVGTRGEYGIIDTQGNIIVSKKILDAKQLSDVVVNIPEEKK
ncbi:copper amine oxidase N-terminal domain-containing protein [Paenibacillus terreus]|uniref:Copper amine oxidase N-terminal domain-containing protein n=1 Tax=Paenibacillus terreus TaxID=1387834 RepID=A0ABV5B4E7_9BACL